MTHVSDDPALARTFALQGEACIRMGAPFTAQVCAILAETLDDTSALGRRVIAWPAANRGGDLVAIRTFGGLHALVRSGRLPALNAVYPPNTTNDAALRDAIAIAIRREDAFLTAFLDSAPQTNEIGRSAILLGGLLTVAHRYALPVALFEIGASAGLNQAFDRWHYDLGAGGEWGPAESPVRIRCDWTGACPSLASPLVVASRNACDLNPLDPRDSADRERLLAFIWADQAERLARATAAFEVAATLNTRPEKADARAWTARMLTPDVALKGVTTVLFHSVFIQYLSPDDRAVLTADIRARGDAATPATPFAWLRMEAGERNKAQCELRLTCWPGATDELLADVDWHGRSAHWASA